MTTLYTAKKYAVPALEKHCVDFLKRNLSPDNAFMLLTQVLALCRECRLTQVLALRKLTQVIACRRLTQVTIGTSMAQTHPGYCRYQHGVDSPRLLQVLAWRRLTLVTVSTSKAQTHPVNSNAKTPPGTSTAFMLLTQVLVISELSHFYSNEIVHTYSICQCSTFSFSQFLDQLSNRKQFFSRARLFFMSRIFKFDYFIIWARLFDEPQFAALCLETIDKNTNGPDYFAISLGPIV